jgi:PAS domain-containing protein
MAMSSTTLGLVSLVLNLLLGTGLIAVLRYKIQARAADKVDFDAIVAALTEQRDNDRERIKQLERRSGELEAEISGLRIARDLDPFPSWVVDLQGCYRHVNREFERLFLEPRRQTYRDIIGKHHGDMWPPTFCRTLKALDDAAHKRPDGTARATTSVDVPHVGKATVTVHKFPVRFKGTVVAIAGYITAFDLEQELIG